jgi:hypothetical protein
VGVFEVLALVFGICAILFVVCGSCGLLWAYTFGFDIFDDRADRFAAISMVVIIIGLVFTALTTIARLLAAAV